jgi:hypothetical protein
MQLNQAYAAALGRLAPEGGRILRESRIGWLRYADAFCALAADPAQRTEAMSCASQAFADRIRDLQLAAVQKGPFLFSRVEDYRVSVLSTRAGRYDTGLARHHVAYPRIDQPATRQTALWNTLVVRKDKPSGRDAGDGDTWTYYSLDLATAKLVSVIWTTSDTAMVRRMGSEAARSRRSCFYRSRIHSSQATCFSLTHRGRSVSQLCCSWACGRPRKTSK